MAIIKEQLHVIRTELSDVEVEGIQGKVLLWWLNPFKNLVADPLLGVAEALVPIVSVVPFSQPIVSLALGATLKTGHVLYGVGAKVGVLKHNNEEEPDHAAEEAAKDFRERLYEQVSLMQTAIGFSLGITTDVLTLLLSEEKLSKWIQTVSDVKLFLDKSGISREFHQEIPDLLPNLIILSRLQAMEREKHPIQSNQTPSRQQLEDGQYYMKYATAAYGMSTIEAAQSLTKASDVTMDDKSLELKDEDAAVPEFADMYVVDTPLEFATRRKICRHLDIDEQAIVAMFVKPGSNFRVLRHFVAIDHEKKAVVLAIRGTFSASEILMDADAYSANFCGGLVHAGIGEQATNMWDAVGDIVKRELAKYPDYELIIAGHSLGAGTASLLTIKCYHEQLVSAKVRCFAFASPPVYTPLKNAPKAVANTINYTHDDDCVSFLSAYNIRELLEYLKAVGGADASWMDRAAVILGKKEPTPALVTAYQKAKAKARMPVPGAPMLLVAASTVVWIRGNNDVGYKAYNFSPKELPDICADVDMLQDHFPPFYEDSLDLLCK